MVQEVIIVSLSILSGWILGWFSARRFFKGARM